MANEVHRHGALAEESAPTPAAPPPFYRTKLFWAKFWLVATGVWWGVCMQLLFYQGAGHPLAQLPNLDWYLGMSLVYFHRARHCFRPDAAYASVKQRHVVPIAICDYLGTVGTTIGLEVAGSAIFGIIFSSVTVWSALFTCCILGKTQSPLRMAGILTVVFGLALPTVGQNTHTDQGQAAVAGIALTAMGTLFYALEYVLCERVYTLYEKPVDAKQLCFYTGAWGLGFTGAPRNSAQFGAQLSDADLSSQACGWSASRSRTGRRWWRTRWRRAAATCSGSYSCTRRTASTTQCTTSRGL